MERAWLRFGGPVRAPGSEYESAKRVWVRSNPDASQPKAYEEACRAIAKSLGL
jgi:hypothetical protein